MPENVPIKINIFVFYHLFKYEKISQSIVIFVNQMSTDALLFPPATIVVYEFKLKLKFYSTQFNTFFVTHLFTMSLSVKTN